jgi:hypothetical protein
VASTPAAANFSAVAEHLRLDDEHALDRRFAKIHRSGRFTIERRP